MFIVCHLIKACSPLFCEIHYIVNWPWIPNFPHAFLLKTKNICCYYLKKITYLNDCVKVLVFRAYETLSRYCNVNCDIA